MSEQKEAEHKPGKQEVGVQWYFLQVSILWLSGQPIL